MVESTVNPKRTAEERADAWREGAASVAMLTFAVDGETPVLAAGRRYSHHAMVMTHQAYDKNRGLPRLLDILAEFDITATFFVPGFVADRWPGVVSRVAEEGHEIAHHSYSHRPSTSLTKAEETMEFERGMESLAALGISPAGYRSPMWAASWHSAEIAASMGLTYDTSLMDDDRPYIIDTSNGPLVELPPHWSLDDWEQYAYLPEPHLGNVIEPPEKALALWLAELDGMREFGGLFQLTAHSFLSGRPGRARNLRFLIEAVIDRGDVIFRTGSELARATMSDPTVLHRSHGPDEPDCTVYPNW